MVDENAVEILEHQLPAYFRPIIEFQEIMKAYGYTLKEIKKVIMRTWDNFYLISCDGQTLSQYEALLGITKTKGLPLEERRAVVLMQYGMRFLYTLPALKEMLTSVVGEDKYSVECFDEKYQLIVKLIDQDTLLVKETYNLVSLMKPAHIVLLLYAEYREDAKAELKQAVEMAFILSFYPLFNLPKLCLNHTWKLDGSKKLNGHDGEGRIDLYPVGMKFEVPVWEEVKEAVQLSFLSQAAEQAESSQEMKVLTSVACKKEIKKEFTMLTSAAAEVKTGNETLYNARKLDGKRKLNGRMKLNGGFYQL